MTRETRNEIIVTALVVSAFVHVGVMIYARPKVMTHVAGGGTARAVMAPMRVTKAVERPEPVKIDAVEDVAAPREAPAVEKTQDVAVPSPSDVPEVTPVAVKAAVASEPTLPKAADESARPVFDAQPLKLDSTVSAKIPMSKIETPSAADIPTISTPLPQDLKLSQPLEVGTDPAAPLGTDPVLPLPAVGTDPDSAFLPTKLAGPGPADEAAEKAEKFVPSEEVYEKVDEKVVEEEKAAVKALVESDAAEELPKFVQTAMTQCREGEWNYFKVMISPRASLAVVPKDIVLLLDASGSIGWDRIISIRKAAKRILRSATNSGDRFNLVAFRNRFTYAFKSWRTCDQASFDRADKWLNNLAAHGRTDVFATISSVLTLPRDPKRPLIALVVTDGDANSGVSENAEILSKFTALNDGLVSVYMYGVKGSANRELIDVLTRGNRGESFVYDGSRRKAGDEIDGLSERFRDPVLSDLRVIFSADSKAEAYPRVLPNLYRGGVIEIVGRVPADVKKVSFALRGLNGAQAYEGFFTQTFDTASSDAGLPSAWRADLAIDAKLQSR